MHGDHSEVVLFLKLGDNLFECIMISIELRLAWKVENEVSTPIVKQLFLYFICEPLQISKEKVGAVEHATIRSQLVLLHGILELNQVLHIDAYRISDVLIGRVQVD